MQGTPSHWLGPEIWLGAARPRSPSLPWGRGQESCSCSVWEMLCGGAQGLATSPASLGVPLFGGRASLRSGRFTNSLFTAGVGNLFAAKSHLHIYNIILGPFKTINFKIMLL